MSHQWPPLHHPCAKTLATLAVVTSLVGVGSRSWAGLMGISVNSPTSSKLWDINTTTGVPSNPRIVSTAPDHDIVMIASSPTGLLYGVSQGEPSDFPPSGKLYLIDAATGVATLVATLTQFVDVEGDMAVDPTDGTLYVVDGGGRLFKINTTTGVCTTVGSLPGSDYSAMGFNNAGDLYIWDSFLPQPLLKVDKTNAAIISSVNVSPSPGGEIGGLAFDPATGTAYLAASNNSNAKLSVVSPNTGGLIPIGPLTGTGGIWGLTFAPQGGECISGLVVDYTFDDAADRRKDSSGNHIDGSYSAAIPVPGRCGAALRFLPNNNVQEFSVPSTPALNITGEMSASAYILIRGDQSTDYNPGCTEGTIFCKGGANWFQVERFNDRLVFQNEPSGSEAAIGVYPFALNIWTQVGFVRGAWTGSAQTIQFYVNCQPIPTLVYENGVSTGTNVMHNPAFSSTDILMVGNYGFGSTPEACEFNGDIDELKIFNKALSTSTMLAICSCPCAPRISDCGDPATLVINTGWDNATKTPLGIGMPDADWLVTGDPDITFTVPRPTIVVTADPDPLDPAWAPALPQSGWACSHDVGVVGHGLYYFDYRFCLANTIGAELHATLREWVEANVELNGVQIGSSIFGTALPSQSPATVNVTDPTRFRSGENLLRIVLENYTDPVGLDLIGTVTGHFPASRACCSDSASVLMGSIWADDDADGVRDVTETPLAGLTLNLSGTRNRTTTSDAGGNYYFTGLPAGTYTVDQTPPTSWTATFPPHAPSMALGHYAVVLDAGEALGSLDFGRKGLTSVPSQGRYGLILLSVALLVTGVWAVGSSPRDRA